MKSTGLTSPGISHIQSNVIKRVRIVNTCTRNCNCSVYVDYVVHTSTLMCDIVSVFVDNAVLIQ